MEHVAHQHKRHVSTPVDIVQQKSWAVPETVAGERRGLVLRDRRDSGARSKRRRRSSGGRGFSPYSPMMFDSSSQRRSSAPSLPSKNFFVPSENVRAVPSRRDGPTLEQCLVVPKSRDKGRNATFIYMDSGTAASEELILGSNEFSVGQEMKEGPGKREDLGNNSSEHRPEISAEGAVTVSANTWTNLDNGDKGVGTYSPGPEEPVDTHENRTLGYASRNFINEDGELEEAALTVWNPVPMPINEEDDEGEEDKKCTREKDIGLRGVAAVDVSFSIPDSSKDGEGRGGSTNCNEDISERMCSIFRPLSGHDNTVSVDDGVLVQGHSVHENGQCESREGDSDVKNLMIPVLEQAVLPPAVSAWEGCEGKGEDSVGFTSSSIEINCGGDQQGEGDDGGVPDGSTDGIDTVVSEDGLCIAYSGEQLSTKGGHCSGGDQGEERGGGDEGSSVLPPPSENLCLVQEWDREERDDGQPDSAPGVILSVDTTKKTARDEGGGEHTNDDRKMLKLPEEDQLMAVEKQIKECLFSPNGERPFFEDSHEGLGEVEGEGVTVPDSFQQQMSTCQLFSPSQTRLKETEEEEEFMDCQGVRGLEGEGIDLPNSSQQQTTNGQLQSPFRVRFKEAKDEDEEEKEFMEDGEDSQSESIVHDISPCMVGTIYSGRGGDEDIGEGEVSVFQTGNNLVDVDCGGVRDAYETNSSAVGVDLGRRGTTNLPHNSSDQLQVCPTIPDASLEVVGDGQGELEEEEGKGVLNQLSSLQGRSPVIDAMFETGDSADDKEGTAAEVGLLGGGEHYHDSGKEEVGVRGGAFEGEMNDFSPKKIFPSKVKGSGLCEGVLPKSSEKVMISMVPPMSNLRETEVGMGDSNVSSFATNHSSKEIGHAGSNGEEQIAISHQVHVYHVEDPVEELKEEELMLQEGDGTVCPGDEEEGQDQGREGVLEGSESLTACGVVAEEVGMALPQSDCTTTGTCVTTLGTVSGHPDHQGEPVCSSKPRTEMGQLPLEALHVSLTKSSMPSMGEKSSDPLDNGVGWSVQGGEHALETAIAIDFPATGGRLVVNHLQSPAECSFPAAAKRSPQVMSSGCNKRTVGKSGGDVGEGLNGGGSMGTAEVSSVAAGVRGKTKRHGRKNARERSFDMKALDDSLEVVHELIPKETLCKCVIS
ncbi:unnamed protein product [Choristocarpus tenellus]